MWARLSSDASDRRSAAGTNAHASAHVGAHTEGSGDPREVSRQRPAESFGHRAQRLLLSRSDRQTRGEHLDSHGTLKGAASCECALWLGQRATSLAVHDSRQSRTSNDAKESIDDHRDRQCEADRGDPSREGAPPASVVGQHASSRDAGCGPPRACRSARGDGGDQTPHVHQRSASRTDST